MEKGDQACNGILGKIYIPIDGRQLVLVSDRDIMDKISTVIDSASLEQD